MSGKFPRVLEIKCQRQSINYHSVHKGQILKVQSPNLFTFILFSFYFYIVKKSQINHNACNIL